jgi:transposase-like protein
LLDVANDVDPSVVKRLRTAASRELAAREDFHRAIREAANAGMSYRQIAGAVGLSFQRVHQIVRRRV